MTRAEQAREYFKQGYACSQAVALAFADLAGADADMVSKMTLPLGGGLGRLRLTCGAVSGMAVAYGMVQAKAEVNAENKMETYKAVQQLCARFAEENGSLICADLLSGKNLKGEVGGTAEKRTDEYYKKRPCAELVYHAAQILEEYVQEQGVL